MALPLKESPFYCKLQSRASVEKSYTDHRIRKKLRVLIPGAGLGRLAYDVAKLGP